jgi:hypothetical protein
VNKAFKGSKRLVGHSCPGAACKQTGCNATLEVFAAEAPPMQRVGLQRAAMHDDAAPRAAGRARRAYRARRRAVARARSPRVASRLYATMAATLAAARRFATNGSRAYSSCFLRTFARRQPGTAHANQIYTLLRRVATAAAGGVGVGVTAAVSAPAAQAEGSGACDNATVVAAVAIVGAAAAGYAFQIGRGETVGVDPDYRYVIDCGSGGTRIEKFSFTLAGICREVKQSPKVVPLDQVLTKDEAQQKRWLAALAQALADDTTPIFIGATAGVRDSVISGVVTKAALKRFEELVLAQFGSRARFALVDGVLEATSELAAVRYCVSKRESALL